MLTVDFFALASLAVRGAERVERVAAGAALARTVGFERAGALAEAERAPAFGDFVPAAATEREPRAGVRPLGFDVARRPPARIAIEIAGLCSSFLSLLIRFQPSACGDLRKNDSPERMCPPRRLRDRQTPLRLHQPTAG